MTLSNSSRSTVSRRTLVTLGAGLVSAGLTRTAAEAQDARRSDGSAPTSGGARPGPLGLDPGPVAKKRGVRPVAIEIEQAQVAAEVEIINIVDGAMQNPTGPWVVSWYEETAGLGQIGNVVLAGHVDYWNVGPAVFWYLKELMAGDRIVVSGEEGESLAYEVAWGELFLTVDLTPEIITDLIYPADKDELLTLVTCGGEFDPGTGEYLSRYIVRAERLRT